jgi:hypothetical protein
VSTDDSGQLTFSGRSQTPDLHRRDTFGCQQIRSSNVTTSPDWPHGRRVGGYSTASVGSGWAICATWLLFALLAETGRHLGDADLSDNSTHPSNRRASPALALTERTGDDLYGQCSVFISDRHASPTSHGMETA